MATVYFKTLKTSETGKKFQALLDKARTIRKEIAEFCKEQGGTGIYVHTNIYAFGTDVISIEILANPDPKIWKKDKRYKGCFTPRRNSKQGKEIYERMSTLPKIEIEELNSIIGVKESFLGTIGYATTNDECFGFMIERNWVNSATDIPKDCQEITFTEYKNLFY